MIERLGRGRGGKRTPPSVLDAMTYATHRVPVIARVPRVGQIFNAGVLYRGPRRGRAVALTFDDGPNPHVTEAFLATLRGRRVTFFSVGERVRWWSDLIGSIQKEGHEVACHGDTHRRLAEMSSVETRDALTRAVESIADAAGKPPSFYRPAYGAFTLAAWSHATRLGMRRTLWSGWARDWEADATPDLIVVRILRAVRPGAILLLHDVGSGAARTLQALPRILDGIQDRGYELVTLSELVAQL